MQKIFRYLLFLYVCVLSLPVMSYDFMVNGLCYNVLSQTGKTVEVTWKAAASPYSGDIKIPSAVSRNGVVYQVVQIGELAFTNVVSVIGNSPTGCTDNNALTSVTIPNSIKTIGLWAFSYCTKLSAMVIPGSVTSIDYSAFEGCSSLSRVKVEEDNTVYDSRNDCNAIIRTSDNYLLVGSCKATIPNSVSTIGSNSFGGYTGLTSISIPNSVKSIESYAFYGCKNLSEVKSEITNPFTIDDYVFCNISLNAVLQVPQGTKSKYQALSGWTKYFKEIVEYGNVNSYTLSITSSGSGYVTCSGTTINSTTKSFTVNQGASATLTFSPNSGYRVGSLKVNGTDVTSSISNNKYTISNISKNTTVSVTFEAIPQTMYSFSVTCSGEGYVSLSIPGYTEQDLINKSTFTYSVKEGTKAILIFNYNSGYRVGSLKVNGVNVTSDIVNNGYYEEYTINSINQNTNVEVVFEKIPTTTYTLSITSSSYGYVTYSGTNINGTTKTFTVNEGTSATLTFTPNSGYRVGSLKINNVDYTSSISNNKYTINNISKNTTVSVTFEAIPPTTYSLSITSSGYGYVTYSGTTINSTTKSFTVNEGTSATLTFTPNSGYRVGSLKVNNVDYTSYISSNKYTISNISKNTTVSVTFEAIPPSTYSLSITSSGYGYVTYSGTTINGTTKSFSVNEGTSATLTFTPNSGYRVGSLKVNGSDVTSSISNNKYTISNISKNTTVSVIFEAIPVTTYTLSITSSGSGYVTYSSTTINSTTKSFTVNQGTSATLTFSPNSGYRVGSLKVNGSDVTSSISNNKYTISNISKNTTVSITFEAIPPTTYTLSITSSGYGYVTYSGTTINGMTKSFTVNEGTSATLTFTPNSGYRVGSLKVNGTDVTSSISNNKYTISNITKNTTVSVTFVEELKSMVVDGVNYTVVSYDNKTVNVASGSYGNALTVPATFTYQGSTWSVVGIESGVLTNLAAIIWNPLVVFTGRVTNPNFLLYVEAEKYAPSSIKNVVVDGTAKSITLTEETSGNDFYCPQAFTAKQIRYTHKYSMTTGINESKGWETIALPFDVQTITHETKGEILPFAKWDSKDNRRPFWLYEMTSSGWKEAQAIKANTPYIISMPNNDKYYEASRLNGSVTFSATNVRVEPTIANTVTYQGKTFTPNFTTKAASTGLYALNVKNQWASDTNGQNEGSVFVQNLRTIHPFEAYMTTTNSTRSSFGIFEDMTTGIRGITELMDMRQATGVYNLKGQKIKIETDRKLPAGVYIINGQKVIVK